MSEHGATTATAPEASHSDHAATRPPELFVKAELDSFDADDAKAGGVIGRMLAMFFIYTVIVMSLSALWTYFSIFSSPQ